MARFLRLDGLTPYAAGHALQAAWVDARAAERVGDAVFLLEHAPTITVGRKGSRDGVLSAGDTPVVEVERGGEVTWHGPGQLVAYPVLSRRGRLDLHAHLRALESAVIDVLAALGVVGARDPRNSGVWMGSPPRKVCSVGIAVRREVTWHGLALNVAPDLREFQRIRPCGFGADVMTSLAAAGVPTTVEALVGPLAAALADRLELGDARVEAASWAELASATGVDGWPDLPALGIGEALRGHHD